MVLLRGLTREFSLRTLLVALLACGLIAFTDHILLFAATGIERDYLQEYNTLTRPALYDVKENAAIDYAQWAGRLPAMPEDVNRVRDVWPEDMNDVERRAVEAWTTANADVVAGLITASHKSQYWIERNEPDGYLTDMGLPELRDLRRLAYGVLLHAKLAASRGDVELALGEMLTGYAMGTQLTGPRSLLEQLTGMGLCNVSMKSAFQLLSRCDVEPHLLLTLQKGVDRLSSRWEHGFDWRGERLIVLDDIQRAFSDDRADTVRLLDDLAASLAVAPRTTPWQARKQGPHTRAVLESQSNPVLKECAVAWTKCESLCWRLRASTAALAATAAILRYRADVGYLPSSLDELVSAGYLDAVPLDPFGDGSFVYRRRDDTFSLYSRGLDFDDDGGVASDWGKGDQGGDKVFWPVTPLGE